MTYIAKITVGRFNVGEEVTGLTEARAEELLLMGAITKMESPHQNEGESEGSGETGEEVTGLTEAEPSESAQTEADAEKPKRAKKS